VARKKSEHESVMVAFDKQGNHIPLGWGKPTVKAPVFKDTLTFSHHKRSAGVGGAMRWTFTRFDGRTVSFSNSEMGKLVPHLYKGKVSGWFTFTKREHTTSCSLVKAGE
jgi:hypothetical protein